MDQVFAMTLSSGKKYHLKIKENFNKFTFFKECYKCKNCAMTTILT